MNHVSRISLATWAVVLALAWTAIPAAAQVSVEGIARRSFEAILRGRQEVPRVQTNTVGEAEIEFNEALTRAEIEVEVVSGVRITQAHLHCAPRGVNGPIIVFLAGFHELGWDVNGEWIGDAVITNDNITDPACGSTLAEISSPSGWGWST
ncbi:MAG: CHRD domain-containing protein [Gemmatimonadetes bacterium]|nr:CHRD domain-containing protein [Gemmatimonadota bacterium]